MLKDVGEKNSTIFLNHSPNAVNDLSAQVFVFITLIRAFQCMPVSFPYSPGAA